MSDFEWDFTTADFNLKANMERLDELEEPTIKELGDILNKTNEVLLMVCQKIVLQDKVIRELDKAVARLCGVSETLEELKEMQEEEEEKSDKKTDGMFL